MNDRIRSKEERVYRTILVPLDGSEAAESVLELAKNLAVRSGAALTLLHVYRPEESEHERLHAAYIQQAAQSVQHDISRICETVQCRFEGVSATAMPALVKGEPAEEIVRYAADKKVSIILMASHGRTGLVHPVMSDIANRVVRNSLIPVWLIRTLGPDEIRCAEWPPKRVLVPLGGSERAEKVLPYAVAYARLFDAELVLLRVCEQPLVTADYPESKMAVSWDEHLKRMNTHYQAQCSLYLGTVKKRLEGQGVKVTCEAMLGNASEQIISYIRDNRCDLVAMTTRGYSAAPNWLSGLPISRWVFSNVTEQVLAATSRGIVLVRGIATIKPGTE
ncbi:MAG: universal stress protein [Chloroflexi bacterium]|nr:universal stress protein [Chloroflexota bacterium]